MMNLRARTLESLMLLEPVVGKRTAAAAASTTTTAAAGILSRVLATLALLLFLVLVLLRMQRLPAQRHGRGLRSQPDLGGTRRSKGT